MNHSWLDNLEEEIDSKLEEFVSTNPYQESLLVEQSEKDIDQSIHNRQQKIKESAQTLRLELLELAKTIKEWRGRAMQAQEAGAKELSERAENHLNHLMELGRSLWTKLNLLGEQFKETENQRIKLSKQSKARKECLLIEKEWANFEVQQELDLLRKKNGPNK